MPLRGIFGTLQGRHHVLGPLILENIRKYSVLLIALWTFLAPKFNLMFRLQ